MTLNEQAIEWIKSRNNNDFLHLESSAKVKCHSVYPNQKFVIFGNFAYDLAPFSFEHRGKTITCTPFALDGAYWISYPDEGTDGMMSILDDGTKTYITTFQFGWLYTEELNRNNQEITEKTTEMLDDGTMILRPILG